MSNDDGKRLDRKARRLLRQGRRATFRCTSCRQDVPLEAVGTKNRNHCPLCLCSRHVDVAIGDRKADCLGAMRPIGITHKSDGVELMLVHQCMSCGKISKNRIAGDDNVATLLAVFDISLNDSEAQQVMRAQGIVACVDREDVERFEHQRV